MGKGIYTHYKERLIEIGGANKCLYLKNVTRKSGYDLGRLLEGRGEKVSELVDFLWSGKGYPLSLINSKDARDILRNLGVQTELRPPKDGEPPLTAAEIDRATRALADRMARALEGEVTKLREIKREAEEIERETGRNDIYVGYPFVFGSLAQGANRMLIKAPLLLFPVKIEVLDEGTVELRPSTSDKIHVNRALILAIAQSKRIKTDDIELEYDNLEGRFKNVEQLIKYLGGFGIKIGGDAQARNVYGYAKFKEPDPRDELSLRFGAILGRFPISGSIFQDYTALEKKNLSNDAVAELLRTRAVRPPAKRRGPKPHSYTVKMLDYAQSEVVRKVDENGNMVIYGPPGTGKSQTIVNIITDAICKHKRVLVVSQKKAALDVVFSRLGPLGAKAMYISDEIREKRSFYDRCLAAHQQDMIDSLADVEGLEKEYAELEKKIEEEMTTLRKISETLTVARPFGLSLSDMYSRSVNIPKGSAEYSTYTELIKEKRLMALSYKELSDALFSIESKGLGAIYFNFMQDREKNPLIDYMLPNLDITTLTEVKTRLEDIQKSKKGLFNTSKHPYLRQVLAFYPLMNSEKSVDEIVRLQRKLQFPKKIFVGGIEKSIRTQIMDTLDAVDEYMKEYDCLGRVLNSDGYLSVVDNILRGNTAYVKLVYEALDNYITLSDVGRLIEGLDKNQLELLGFAYTRAKSYAHYTSILDTLMQVRIYHEVLRYEEECKAELGLTVDFHGITEKIYRLKEAQLEVAYKLCSGKNSRAYETLYEKAKNNKDYLYQISKKQKLWPIRKTMEVYGQFVLTLFPCWLLSPENVSNLLPLDKNLFDVVIFDEASQVFIESTIPAIYRGKSIVVAGDDKQLRPSATFMKRFLGTAPEDAEDYSVQAALEVDSLLDLAVARYESANLTYHYRSRHQELIDFSNYAFYGASLQIAPNISKNLLTRPIERYKVDGKWIDRRNIAEAEKVVELVKKLFATRKNNESIGIITFNSDQQSTIADAIDREMARDTAFRADMQKERTRTDNGEDSSIFVKNLENVQGDERDIIIFSIGYAPGENGRLYTSFGSLSQEGGENRLNVAITRAKSQIIVVTSIEPEDLKVEGSKHLGPKLLQKYLLYVRAVAEGRGDEASVILSSLDQSEKRPEPELHGLSSVEEQMKARLEKLGYSVDTGIGNRKNRISLAIYDPASDRYLVGVELDKDAFAACDSVMERDVYKPRFLESRGWTIVRVWCRDWWLSPTRVIKNIAAIAERNKKKA